MHTTKQHFDWNDLDSLEGLIRILSSGGVVVGSSDTVLGLLAPTSLVGSQTLDRIKGRSEKNYITLIADESKLSNFVDLPLKPSLKRLTDACWPGPLTLILKAKPEISEHLKSARGTIALRIPAHKGLLHVLQHFQGLFSTSANKSGYPVAQSLEALDAEILDQIAAFVFDTEKKELDKPSTIIDASQGELVILREGAYSRAKLQELCELIIK